MSDHFNDDDDEIDLLFSVNTNAEIVIEVIGNDVDEYELSFGVEQIAPVLPDVPDLPTFELAATQQVDFDGRAQGGMKRPMVPRSGSWAGAWIILNADGTAFNPTGWSVEMCIRRTFGEIPAMVRVGAAQIAQTQWKQNVLGIVLTPAQTTALLTPRVETSNKSPGIQRYVYDIELTKSGLIWRVAQGVICAMANVTYPDPP